jgi:hypothetical protein
MLMSEQQKNAPQKVSTVAQMKIFAFALSTHQIQPMQELKVRKS